MVYQNSISHQTTVAEVLSEVRKAIVLGRYEDGKTVSEQEISQKYEVSRSTVRSVMASLEVEGLIEVGPTGRKVVRGMTEDRIRDHCDIRTILEKEAARRLLQKKHVDYSEMARICMLFHSAQYEQPEIRKTLYANANTMFHREMIRLAGSDTLMQCYKTLEAMITSVCELNARYNIEHNSHDYYASHREMLDLLMNKDERIYEFLENHLQVATYVELLRTIQDENKSMEVAQ